MKRTTLILLAAWTLLRVSAMGFVAAAPPRAPVADVSPRIEVAFVLDTTSSMAGLIEGAKRKIWTIARHMVSGKPAPTIKLGLVGYRDLGDEYVTRVFDLTDDVDAIYGHLMEFRAVGGGDKPESVNQALNEAVTRLSWSKDANALRIIFLVGDAPPHMDYPAEVKYPETIQQAIRAGIIINAIQCGADMQTTQFWQEIAAMAQGAYVQINQSGGMTAISTPVDAELARLSEELSRTVVPYGDAARQAEVRTKGTAARTADADRMVFLNIDRAEFGAKVVVTGEGELIWDVVNHKVKLEDVPESDLPVMMKGMTGEQRTTFVAEQFAKRKELQIKVDELATERAAHVKGAIEKLVATGNADSFDLKVAQIIGEQARRKGIQFDLAVPTGEKK
jgi:von Willebrand factor type A domain